MFNYLMFHCLMLHCIKGALGCPYLMSNIPLFYMVPITVGIVAAAPFNVALFWYCTVRCHIFLKLHHFNFPLVFAALFNVALL